jgi:hypothetical protein
MNERIKELMEQTGVPLSMPFDKWCEKFAALVAAHEREACAKLCESHVRQPSRLHFAAAIRARGTT